MVTLQESFDSILARGFSLPPDPVGFVRANSAFNNPESFLEAQRLFPGWPRTGDPDIVIWPGITRADLLPCSNLHGGLGWAFLSPSAICEAQLFGNVVDRSRLQNDAERTAQLEGAGIGGFFGDVANVLRQGAEAIREVIPPESVARIVATGAAVVLTPAVGSIIGRSISADQASQGDPSAGAAATQAPVQPRPTAPALAVPVVAAGIGALVLLLFIL